MSTVASPGHRPAPSRLVARNRHVLGDQRDQDRSATDSRGRRRLGRRSRALRLSLAVAALAVLALLGAGLAVYGSPADDPLVGAPVITVEGDTVALSMVGDTLLGDAAQPLIDLLGASWVGTYVDPFPPGDVVLANLEGPITDRTEAFDPTQQWSYNADPVVAQALADLGVDVVSLANNHAFDRGPEGLADTMANAAAVDLFTIGAGSTSAEARLPLLVRSDSMTIAVTAFGDSGGAVTAAADRPGLRRASADNFVADLELAHVAGADRVVAFVHWGENYADVDDRQRALARSLVDAGYDLVIGHGPHTVQPIEYIDGVPVVFSLGNWIFGTPGRFTGEFPGYGLVVRAVLDANDMALEVQCVVTDNELVIYQPRPCTRTQADRVVGGLHPSMRMVDGVGHLGAG